MKLERCPNGHYYDAEINQVCPQCSNQDFMMRVPTEFAPGGMPNPGDESTVALRNEADGYAPGPMGGDGSTVPLNREPFGVPYTPTQPVYGTPGGYGGGSDTVPLRPGDDPQTVSFYERADVNIPKGVHPAVGWLVCLSGSHRGEDFRLTEGRNTIGRDKGFTVCLRGEGSVSNKIHAAVVFDPKSGKFMVTPGESQGLAYLNGEAVLSKMPMKKNDKLEVGDVKLMLIPCCDEAFSWSDKEE